MFNPEVSLMGMAGMYAETVKEERIPVWMAGIRSREGRETCGRAVR